MHHVRHPNAADRPQELGAAFRTARAGRRRLPAIGTLAFEVPAGARGHRIAGPKCYCHAMSAGSQGQGLGAELLQLYRLLTPVRRRELLSLLFLMLLGGLAELAAIGSVVPFLS